MVYCCHFPEKKYVGKIHVLHTLVKLIWGDLNAYYYPPPGFQVWKFTFFKLCYMTQHPQVEASPRLKKKKKKRVTTLLCKCLGIGTGSSLQIAQSRYHIAHTQAAWALYLSLTLVFTTWLTLLKLEVHLILGSWADVLPHNPSSNPTEHFPPGRDLATRKSWTRFGPELMITTPTHHPQNFHYTGLIPMMPIVCLNFRLFVFVISECHFLSLCLVPRTGSISSRLLLSQGTGRFQNTSP